jgi:hypothetical protein
MFVLVFSALSYPVQARALKWADPPYKESCQMLKNTVLKPHPHEVARVLQELYRYR